MSDDQAEPADQGDGGLIRCSECGEAVRSGVAEIENYPENSESSRYLSMVLGVGCRCTVEQVPTTGYSDGQIICEATEVPPTGASPTSRPVDPTISVAVAPTNIKYRNDTMVGRSRMSDTCTVTTLGTDTEEEALWSAYTEELARIGWERRAEKVRSGDLPLSDGMRAERS